jgi:hypothetical protein
MTNYKKRSQSLMDEISENLKRTIKKYNEIDVDTDLSVIQSVENEDSSKMNSRDVHKSSESVNNKFERERVEKEKNEKSERNEKGDKSDRQYKPNNIINNTKKIMEYPTKYTNYNSNTNNVLLSSRDENFSPNRNFKPNSNLNNKANKILEDLDEFGQNLNKDFKDIEDIIESMIEKDLKNISYK